ISQGVAINLSQRSLNSACGRRVGHIHVPATRPDDLGSEPQAVQNQMGTVAQQPPVLDRGGLTFLSVRDDNGVVAATAGVAHRPQFHGHRERRAAPPDQTAEFDFLEQPVRSGDGAIALARAISGEILDTGLRQDQAGSATRPRRDREIGWCAGGFHGCRFRCTVRLADMRTAVVRVEVDPAGELTPAQLSDAMVTLRGLADGAGAGVVDNDLSALPVGRREVELLMTGAAPDELKRTATDLCAKAFGTTPVTGVLTYVSRGTDDDAHGVLAGFGLTGEISRSPGDAGWDVVQVTLRKADLARVPESRIHTALEASLNCEVHIRTV
ncbi:MAG: hypothetical protein QOC62_3160, partial [Mycobacterium sp.]|nr:hypothetical protein [Mycobacterium sp.]